MTDRELLEIHQTLQDLKRVIQDWVPYRYVEENLKRLESVTKALRTLSTPPDSTDYEVAKAIAGEVVNGNKRVTLQFDYPTSMKITMDKMYQIKELNKC